MKHFLLLSFFTLLLAGMNDRLYAQPQQGTNLPRQQQGTSFPGQQQEQQDTPTRLLRLYEDNDFINIRGQGTDNAYTNGTRIDFFYTKKRPSRWFIDRLMPKAGDSSVNLFGWGVTQLMFTPDNIASTDYQPNDYPWSGGLFATHSLYSYNPRKKYDFQTELILGAMGPASLADQTQKGVHRFIQYQQPKGWGHQFRNDLLLNINLTAEKQLWSWRSAVEVIGGSQAFLGTMLNGVAVYPLIRIGKMSPYFQGYLSQYTSHRTHIGSKRRSRLQAYFVLKPEASLIFTNALLEGGMFTSNPNLQQGNGIEKGTATNGTVTTGQANSASQPTQSGSASQPPTPYHDLQRVVYSINYGAVVSSGYFSISFIQNTSSAMMKGLYSHEFGNISLYFSW